MATVSGYQGNWLGISDRYLGVKFLIESKVHYGWIGFRSVLSHFPRVTAALGGWAYETQPNTTILAGDKGVAASVHTTSGNASSLEVLASGHAAIEQRRKRTASTGGH